MADVKANVVAFTCFLLVLFRVNNSTRQESEKNGLALLYCLNKSQLLLRIWVFLFARTYTAYWVIALYPPRRLFQKKGAYSCKVGNGKNNWNGEKWRGGQQECAPVLLVISLSLLVSTQAWKMPLQRREMMIVLCTYRCTYPILTLQHNTALQRLSVTKCHTCIRCTFSLLSFPQSLLGTYNI